MNILQELQKLNLTEEEILFTYKTSVFRENQFFSVETYVSKQMYFKRKQMEHLSKEEVELIHQEVLKIANEVRNKHFKDLLKIKRQSELQEKEYDEVKDLHSYGYIDSLNLTSKELRENMKENEFSTPFSHTALANNLFFPKVATHFYWYLLKNKKVPLQQEFFDSFFDKYNDFFSLVVPNEDMASLKTRVNSGYTSIYQQFEHYHFLKETGLFEKVYFNLKADIEGKVDCFVKKDGKWYGLQLRVLSKFSDEMYEKKKNRNPIIYDKTVLIDTPIDKSEGSTIKMKTGKSFIFYNEIQLKQTLKHIEVLQLKVK